MLLEDITDVPLPDIEKPSQPVWSWLPSDFLVQASWATRSKLNSVFSAAASTAARGAASCSGGLAKYRSIGGESCRGLLVVISLCGAIDTRKAGTCGTWASYVFSSRITLPLRPSTTALDTAREAFGRWRCRALFSQFLTLASSRPAETDRSSIFLLSGYGSC
jgi:hypothetical protein